MTGKINSGGSSKKNIQANKHVFVSGIQKLVYWAGHSRSASLVRQAQWLLDQLQRKDYLCCFMKTSRRQLGGGNEKRTEKQK